MCRPIDPEAEKAINKSSTSKPSGSRNKIALYLSLMVAAFSVALPIIVSEAAGGWTHKYTSPGPVFTASDIGDLKGRVAIVTGSNTGIGYHTALELARNGAEVIVAARSRVKGEAAVARIVRDAKLDNTDNSVVYMPLDLSSLKSVKSFASDFLKLNKPLHILVNNAGVMKSPGEQYIGQNLTYGFEITADGFESHIGINHVGHFYLTQLLTKKLKASAPSRVVAVSSAAESGSYPEGMRFDLWRPDGQGEEYEDGKAYGQSKLANLMFVRELAARLEGTGVSAYSCHPGVIVSELDRYMAEEFEKDAESKALPARLALTAVSAIIGNLFKMAQFGTADGALTQLQLATADSSQLTNGAFYHPIGRVVKSGHAEGSNVALQKLLWEHTEKVLRKVL